MLNNAQFFNRLNHDFSLYAQAARLHRLGYLPCRPGFGQDRSGYLDLVCRWNGWTPPGLMSVPATALIRAAFVAWKHETALGLAAPGDRAAHCFIWISVSKNNPVETMTLWRLGTAGTSWRILLRSVVNTGTHNTTPNGSWPIYWRLKTARMEGTTSSGRHYDVRAVPWVNYYHGNDAIHGFARAYYGFPQSAGCVELPVSVAKRVFGMLHDGALVTVSGTWRWRAGYSPHRPIVADSIPSPHPHVWGKAAQAHFSPRASS